MKPKIVYRVAAAILLLFAIGHSFSFSLVDPKWGLDAMLAQMRTIRFGIGGIERTYWDFFLASGLTVGILYLFSAILAWQLASLPASTLKQMRLVTWALPLAFAGVFAVSSVHLFLIPQMFSAAATLCLLVAAWVSGREAR